MHERGTFDLVVIGGGINGCGLAADAAGRGLSVLLAEARDLGSGTSSASSKLIHGGLRYLEHHEFRLVREALAEREVLLAKAPHIVWPMRFVLPHVTGQRPRWMIRAGLFLYDHLSRRKAIPGSRALDLARDPAGRPLEANLRQGFAYWDCWVDDARLVVLNARAAADLSAEIATRTRMTAAQADGHAWRVSLLSGNGTREVRARVLVNAAGPWVDRVDAAIERRPGGPRRPRLKLVKGSHIVVRRINGADDAYLLQSADGRVVFALPYEQGFTLIGTTEVAYSADPAAAAIDDGELAYLLDLAGGFFRQTITRNDVVWTYAGVRPLYDDDSGNLSSISRDYRLTLEAGGHEPPLLTILGGKITTYRRLAEEALARLAVHLPGIRGPWTATAPLPGGDMTAGGFQAFLEDLHARRPGFARDFLSRLARRHGTRADRVIGDARDLAGLGADLGHGLTEREVLFLKEQEWARTPEDVLWRRTKIGLHVTSDQRKRAEEAIAALLAT